MMLINGSSATATTNSHHHRHCHVSLNSTVQTAKPFPTKTTTSNYNSISSSNHQSINSSYSLDPHPHPTSTSSASFSMLNVDKMSQHVPSSTLLLNSAVVGAGGSVSVSTNDDDLVDDHVTNSPSQSSPLVPTIDCSTIDNSIVELMNRDNSRSSSPDEQQTNGSILELMGFPPTSSSLSSSPGTVNNSNSQRNKRKNFKPRCISDELLPATTSNVEMDQDSTSNILKQQQQLIMEQLFGGNNSSLMANSLLSQLITDHLNNSQPTTQTAPGSQASSPNKLTASEQQHQQTQSTTSPPLDLSNQESQLQLQQQQQMFQQMLMMQQQQKNSLSHQHLFELFLWKNIKNNQPQTPPATATTAATTSTITSASGSSSSSTATISTTTATTTTNNDNDNHQQQITNYKNNQNKLDPPKPTEQQCSKINVDNLNLNNICSNNNNNLDHQPQMLQMMMKMQQNQQQHPNRTKSSNVNHQCNNNNVDATINPNNNNNKTTPQPPTNLMEFLQNFYQNCFINNNNGSTNNRQQQQQQSDMIKQLFQQQQSQSHQKQQHDKFQQRNNINNNTGDDCDADGDGDNSSVDDADTIATIATGDHSTTSTDVDELSATTTALSQRQQQQLSDMLLFENKSSMGNLSNKNNRKEQKSVERPQEHRSSLSNVNSSFQELAEKGLDVQKLKQLQQLYRLNLMQQLDVGANCSNLLSGKSSPFSFDSFLQMQNQLQNSSNGNNNKFKPSSSLDQNDRLQNSNSGLIHSNQSESNKVDNVAYVKDLFQNKVINAKTQATRPLSSWKQSINACGPGPAPWIEKSTLHSLGIQGELIHKSLPIDYTHYVKRYANAGECGNSLCRELSYREHFHCNTRSCNSRVFMKKEEMIRHFKWHKKRDESLTHGFLRCSPGDNCIERFKNCPHSRKQTHYHCLKRGCDKVYISTSDVQMHANYHRKDTAIIQEGFQRFRATENCLLESCAFFGQKTTHFHCRRDNCNHTFKNKADMEKHKSYHVRDEQLARDGFRKFQKHETCNATEECRSSRVCNHYHCLRSGCAHVLHSTAQLYPHKRKHERCEKELAYRKYRLAQTIYQQSSNNQIGQMQMQNRLAAFGINLDIDLNQNEDFEAMVFNSDDDSAIDNLIEELPVKDIISIPIEEMIGDNLNEARCLKYIQRHSQLSTECNFLGEFDNHQSLSLNEHYNCLDCNICWTDQSSTIIHARKHVIQEEVTPLMFVETSNVNVCNSECLLNQTTVRHYHCRMFGCVFILPIQDKTLKRLDHYKYHEEQQHLFNLYLEDLPPPMPPPPPTLNHNLNNSNNTNNIDSCSSSSNKTPNTAMSEMSPQKTSPISTPPPNQSPSQSQQSKSATKSSKQENNSKNSNQDESPAPLLQMFPTGASLVTIDGLPVLKRKRGRPPKIRTELTGKSSKKSSTSTNSQQPSPSQLAAMAANAPTAIDIAQALTLRANLLSSSNIPLNFNLNHQSSTGNGGDLSKTIPIPLIMPYIKSSMHIGFYVFDEETLCPNVNCIYLGQKHFHCSKPRCYYSTNRDDNTLVEHSKDFHDNIDILEGFVYFDENVDCKSIAGQSDSCSFNRKQRHFHCTRNGCDFSFARYSMMQPHDQKHLQQESANHKLNDEDQDLNNDHEDDDDESGGQSDELKIANFDDEEQDEDDENHLNNSKTKTNKNKSTALKTTDSNEQFMMQNRMGGLFGGSIPPIPSMPFEDIVKQHPVFDDQNLCNTGACKMKRRHHLHCNICNQVFTNYERLIPHCLKHLNNYPTTTTSQSSNENMDDLYHQNASQNHSQNSLNAAANANFQNEFFQMLMNNLMLNNFQESNQSTTGSTMNPLLQSLGVVPPMSVESFMKNLDPSNNISSSVNKRRSSFSSDSSNNNSDFGVKKSKTQSDNAEKSSSAADMADQSSPSPNGYLRFRFNEDCRFSNCVYREHQTHFHCMRKDCGYSFCDKTRFVQHTARHERLDSLMGGDFQQYRCSVSCGQPECPYGNQASMSASNPQSKTSHFHCLKCDYICADTNKVVAHRRQHAKLFNVSAAGFEKYSPNQDCLVDQCNYKLKQTHYHCSTCNYSVLGLSQMASHKQKHSQAQHHQQSCKTSPSNIIIDHINLAT